jgi:hypothetical protein
MKEGGEKAGKKNGRMKEREIETGARWHTLTGLFQ